MDGPLLNLTKIHVCKQKELSVHCKNWVVVCKKNFKKKRGVNTKELRRQLSTKWIGVICKKKKKIQTFLKETIEL